MSAPNSLSAVERKSDSNALDAQCSALRRELEQQRQLLKQQWGAGTAQDAAVDTGHFPRSTIMRFIMRSKNSALLILFAKWQMARHFPGLVFWKIK